MKKTSLSLVLGLSIILLGACSQQNLDTDITQTEESPQVPAVPQKSEYSEDKRRENESDSVGLTDSVNPSDSPKVIKPVTSIPKSLEKKSSGEMMQSIRLASEPVDRENYAHFDDNPVKRVTDSPVSTFSIDVDTAAYANVRRMLNNGQIPRKDAVRIEELVNYFNYDYDVPVDDNKAFSTQTEIAPSPWNKDALLLHVGIKGYEVPSEERPASNLVFLLDVSGSMNSPDKLGLLKSSLKLLSKQLTSNDRIAIAVYAGAAGTVLESTPGNQQAKIIAALV